MILHIDMDAFFAAIEQRDNPALKGKPVIVSGNSKRSVVSTASYEARVFGIGSAMPVFRAKQKCGNLIIVQGNMQKYRNDSQKIMTILSHFSPVMEQVSIDEAYLDIKGCQRLFGSPEKMALLIKKKISEELFLSCSIGIAPLKFLAKIASDMNKPDGLTIIEKSRMNSFILSLPIQKIPGVGKNAMKHMHKMQIKTLGDINKYTRPMLTKQFGKMGHRLLELSKGIDPSIVQTHYVRKSISSETTLETDIIDSAMIRQVLLEKSGTVGKDLRKKNLISENVVIKIKFSDFTQITRSKKLDTPICSSRDIFNAALTLYQKIKIKKKIRLIGVGVTALKDKNTPVQMLLIPETGKNSKQWEIVDCAVDSISEKFGTRMVQQASLSKNKSMEESDFKF